MNFSTKTSIKETKQFASLDNLRLWLAEDFRNFLQYANGFYGMQTGRIQLHIADELQAGNNPVVFLLFRNSTKTWEADLWIAWKLLCNPNFTIMILSAKHDAGRKHMSNLKNLISTLPALSHLHFSKSNETMFDLEGHLGQEPTLRIESIYSGSVTGSHVDIMLLDDVAILQTEESEGKRNKLRYILSSNVMPVVLPIDTHFKHLLEVPIQHRTNVVYLGTPWVSSSLLLYEDALKSEQEFEDEGGHPLAGAKRIIIPALDELGESNFPEKWSTLQLTTQRKSMSKVSWALHMMLNPMLLDKESNVVNIENIVKKNLTVKEPIMTVDPAGEDGSGDEHAVAIGGPVYTDKMTKIHITNIKGWNAQANEFVDQALRLAREMGVWKIYVESKFNSYRTLFQNKIAEMGNFATIESYNPTGNKQRRLVELLDPNINNGTVSFEPSVFDDKLTSKQFKTWTYKNLPEYDDRLDALAMLVSICLSETTNTSEWKLDAYNSSWG